ncbi:MAG TPA: hypothetical protein VJ840_08670 [Gemmatimonadaceae bacterium]|nr:hypothetical protein [Gemmatimonadaceae bacterium]
MLPHARSVLRAYAVSVTIALGSVLVMAFNQNQHTRFTEIDVERINIIEKDGRVRLVISNKDRSPPPIERGVPFGYAGGNRPGMIFYNEEGTENGGLIFSGQRDSTGYHSSGSLTFDQYDQDQTVALQYIDQNGRRRSGLAINDYTPGLSSLQLDLRYKRAEALKDSAARADSMKVLSPFFPKQRLYVGRARDGSSQLTLSGADGRPRLKLSVDSAGAARIQFLDDSGHVTRSIPDTH